MIILGDTYTQNLKFLFYFKLYVCVPARASARDYRFPENPEEVIRFPGTGVRDGCRLRDLSAGTLTMSSVIVASTLPQ